MGESSTPFFQHTFTPFLLPVIGMVIGYVLLLWTVPIRLSLRDGLRCLGRFKRFWLIFALLACAYAIFQFATFTPFESTPDFRIEQFRFWETWHWPGFGIIWRDSAVRALEAVAGIFDAAATTYPLSVLAAVLLIANWRGLHWSLVQALRKQFGAAGWLIYLGVLTGALASLVKPLLFAGVPQRLQFLSPARVLQSSAAVDGIAFIFEYLCAVYIQVYLITVALAWIKGLHFEEEALLKFAMRRFSFVLKWAWLVILCSTLLLRLPLLVAYFRNLPGVLDYLPLSRLLMAGIILIFASMQVSLVLHNESLRAAFGAHWHFVKRNALTFLWFVTIALLHFWFLTLSDAAMREAATGRTLALILWKLLYLSLYSFLTGWLLASWVCLFRQCEFGRRGEERWIAY